MTQKLLIKNLVKNFGDKQVLTGVDLQVNKGESLVILGGSGSGKSVLIKIIANLMNPTSGSIQIDGKEATNIGAKDRDKLMEKFGLTDATIQKIDTGLKYGLPVSYFSMLLLDKNMSHS